MRIETKRLYVSIRIANLQLLSMVNYYKILKVSPNASAAEIKSAYRGLARKIHPDVNENSEKAAEDFALIAKAYEILSDENERAYFDRRLSNSNGSIHSTDSVFHSDNSHAQKLRQITLEHKYNQIVDQMIAAERDERLALQKVIFPIVALFVSTFAVGIFRPAFWTNSAIIGKIVIMTLFVVGVLRLARRLSDGFRRFTYSRADFRESLINESDEPLPPYTRSSAIAFLFGGLFVSMVLGILIGGYLEMFIATMMPKVFSASLKPEFLLFPPIVGLLVDAMHSIISRLDL